jgi:hypothetical protein
MKDGVVLMYMKDDVLYPVALSESQFEMLQLTSKIFEPLQVVFSKPQGEVVNLIKSK